MFRNLRNDKMYRDGRELLTADGKHGKPDDRMIRAVGKKTGLRSAGRAYLVADVRIHLAGAAVRGRARRPAADLQRRKRAADGLLRRRESRRARAQRDRARRRTKRKPLFVEVLRNIEIMLQNGMIHGDLSAYNILYWEGEITLIDFPQVTDSHINSQAYKILERDITRVCEYFAGQGVRSDPDAIMWQLWKRYVELDAKIRAADLSALFADDDDE